MRQGLVAALAIACIAIPAPLWAAQQPRPGFTHGVGEVVAGLLFEMPKTVLQATMSGPPVVGTAVGLLAGVSQGIQRTIRGLIEMVNGLDPWGVNKKTPTRKRTT